MISRTDARRPFDPRLQTTILAVVLSGAALALVGALATRSANAALSISIGAAIAAANLWALARIVTALLPGAANDDRAIAPNAPEVKLTAGFSASPSTWALLAGLKFIGLVSVVWLLMRGAVVSPLPMLVGFGALPMGIAFGALVSDRSADREP